MRITTTQGKEYLEYWLYALAQLLGWSRQRASIWATHYEAALNDEGSFLFGGQPEEGSLLWREHPMFYISFLLIPDSVKDKLTPMDRLNLARRLEGAIFMRGPCNARTMGAYDWNAAIARVDAILSEYGESLDNVRRQYEE